MRKPLAAILTAASIACSVALSSFAAADNEVGDRATGFTLRSTSGDTVSLHQYAGKVVVLSFFHPFCGSCIRELPALEQNIWRVYQSGGVQVVGVTTADPRDAKAAVDAYDLTYPVLLDPNSETWTNYKVHSLPVNLVIDKDMVVRYREVGYYEPDIAAKIEELAPAPVEQSCWGRIRCLFR